MTSPVTASSSPGRQVMGPCGTQSKPPELVPTRWPVGSLLTSLVTEICRGSSGAASGFRSSNVRSSGAPMVAHPERAKVVASSRRTNRWLTCAIDLRSIPPVVRQRICANRRLVKRLVLERRPERLLECPIAERVAAGLKPRRYDALARQQELVGHLAQRHAGRERR